MLTCFICIMIVFFKRSKWPVLEGVTATLTMSSQPKTHPRDRPTRQTSRDTSENWKQCTRSRRERSMPSSDQRWFSPSPTSLKFWSSPTPRPTRPKTSKTMAPRRRSAPIHPRRIHSWNTPRSPWPSLRRAPSLRPETLLSKRARETFWMSAS